MARKTVADTLKAVSKKSNEVAKPYDFRMIEVKNLEPHPENNEDVSNTSDLENSMKSQGFTEPIEVTEFGHEDGKFTIVSGHRRIEAAKKVGIEVAPCVVRTFKSEADVRKALLFGNLHRDSAKDPLLWVMRFIKFSRQCIDEGIKETKHVKLFSETTGLSEQMVYLYRDCSRVPESWDMIREGKIAMTSVTRMGVLDSKERIAVLKMFERYLDEHDGELSKRTADKIINGYKNDQNYDEIMTVIEKGRPQIAGLDYPDSSLTQTEGKQLETKDEPNDNDRNNEVNREFEDDFENENNSPDFEEPDFDFENESEDKENKQSKQNNENPDVKNGKELMTLCQKLDKFSEENVEFRDGKTAGNAIVNAIYVLIDTLREMPETESITDDEYKKMHRNILDYVSKNEL